MSLDGKTKLWEMRESSLCKDGIDKYELPVAFSMLAFIEKIGVNKSVPVHDKFIANLHHSR